MTKDDLQDNLNFDDLIDSEYMKHPDILNTEFNKRIEVFLNKLAPEKEKTITTRKLKPWFDENITISRRIMRRKEKTWVLHKTTPNWKEYTKARKSYHA